MRPLGSPISPSCHLLSESLSRLVCFPIIRLLSNTCLLQLPDSLQIHSDWIETHPMLLQHASPSKSFINIPRSVLCVSGRIVTELGHASNFLISKQLILSHHPVFLFPLSLVVGGSMICAATTHASDLPLYCKRFCVSKIYGYMDRTQEAASPPVLFVQYILF